VSARKLITEHLGVWTGAVTQKSTRGRGNSGKIDLIGVRKLRQLVLELGIRGKLVPQDPDETPAVSLIERVSANKSELLRTGEIKKSHKLPEIAPDEVEFTVPTGWRWARLGELTQKIGSGATPRGGKSAYVATGIPFLRSQNIWNDEVALQGVALITPETHERMSNTQVYPNDILLNITGASLGRCTIVPTTLETANVSQHVTIIRTIEPINRQYLHHLILSPYAQSMIWSRQVGMAREGLSKKVLELFEIPVPPLDEQHRIVQKVDELMALCDRLEQQTSDQLKAHETLVDTLLGTLTQSENATELAENWARLAAHFDTLFTTEQSIDRLKQTVLQLAVMGRLVEQDVGDETVEALIARLQDEKHQLVKQGDIRKPKKVPPTLLESHPFPIPLTWRWARLSFLVSILGDGLHGTPKYSTNGDFYFINGTNLRRGKISTFPETKRVTSEEYSKYKKDLNSRTMLVSINGTLGNIALYNGERVVLGKSACYFNLLECLSKSYIRVVLESPYFVSYAKNLATGSTIKNLSLRAMNELLIPLPPPNEQNRIVQKVDELMALCDQLKERLNQTSETRCQLAGAVVKKALN
jgi:type I restriction enzyme S subunit